MHPIVQPILTAPFALLFVNVLFAALTLPAILMDADIGASLASDERLFHLPQITYFIHHGLDLTAYEGYAPTIPGYHLAMAMIGRALGYGDSQSAVLGLKLMQFLIGLCVINCTYVVAQRLRRLDGHAPAPFDSAILLLPFATSWYVAMGSVYFSTDLAGYLGLLAVIGACSVVRPNGVSLSLALTAMVIARHTFAPVLPIALLSQLRKSGSWRSLFVRDAILFSGAVLILPTALLIFFIWQWKGLVPPGVQAEVTRAGFFPHALIHACAFLGLLTAVFLPLEIADLRRRWRTIEFGRTVTACVVVVIVLWILVPSNFDSNSGRWGSIVWTLAKITPTIADRSPAVLFFAVAGAVFIGYLIERSATLSRPPMELLALGLYLAGHIFTMHSYQRYSEIVTLPILALFFNRIDNGSRAAWQYIPLALLVVANAAFTAFRFYFLPVSG